MADRRVAWGLAPLFLVCLCAAAQGDFSTLKLLPDGVTEADRVLGGRTQTEIISYVDLVLDPLTLNADFEDRLRAQGFQDPRLLSSSGARWDSVRRSFDAGQPRIEMSDSWRSEEQQLVIGLNVAATGFQSGKFRVDVSLSATPMSSVMAMIPIGRVVDESPENIFVLSKELRANPYRIDEVQIPCNWRTSESDLLKRYVSQVQLALVKIYESSATDRAARPLTPLERTQLLGCVDGR